MRKETTTVYGHLGMRDYITSATGEELKKVVSRVRRICNDFP